MPVGAGYWTMSTAHPVPAYLAVANNFVDVLDMHYVFRAVRMTARVQRKETNRSANVKRCGCVPVCNVLFLHLAFAMLDHPGNVKVPEC